jgi:hypothetical protein
MKILILVTMMLTGCAPVIFDKPGITQETFARDNMSCRGMAVQEAMIAGLQGNAFAEITIRSKTYECLKGLGYIVRSTN